MSGRTSYVYVYAIARPEAARAVSGVDGVEPGARPFAIEGAGLAAIASEVPAGEYAEDVLHRHLSDLAWAGEKGIAHERVVETAVLAAPTVPLRFCTIFESEERVRALLERHAARFDEILADLAGKAEWGLQGFIDRPRFEAFLAKERAAVQEAKPAGGAGRAYLEKKKAALDAQRASGAALAEALAEAFAAHAAAADRAVRQPIGASGELALKGAFLVSLSEHDRFETAAAAERARREPMGIRLRVTGPWPPYAFVPPLEEGAS